MHSIRQRVAVEYSYDIHFTEGLLETGNALLAGIISSDGEQGPKKVLVVLDGGLLTHHPELPQQLSAYAARYGEALTLAAEPVEVPGGEAAKNDPTLLDRIHRAIHEAGLCRHSYVLVVGGGAVLDLAGYAAATAHRGVRLIRVPTTVLAQNDSAVGVKNGINAFGKKNFLGSFAPPHAVLNDFNFLETLKDRDWRAGTSEAMKVALIKDPEFFDFLATNARSLAPPSRDLEKMQVLITRCAALHLDHIARSGDPFEMGSSRPLDFGHWSAHKLEQMTRYELRHGEAVAIGIALDACYSHLAGLLAEHELHRILDAFDGLGFQLYIPEMENNLSKNDHSTNLFAGLTEFREHLGGPLTIMLLEGIGRGIEVHAVDQSLYRKAIGMLRDHASRG